MPLMVIQVIFATLTYDDGDYDDRGESLEGDTGSLDVARSGPRRPRSQVLGGDSEQGT